jgi:hypothetical protein
LVATEQFRKRPLCGGYFDISYRITVACLRTEQTSQSDAGCPQGRFTDPGLSSRACSWLFLRSKLCNGAIDRSVIALGGQCLANQSAEDFINLARNNATSHHIPRKGRWCTLDQRVFRSLQRAQYSADSMRVVQIEGQTALCSANRLSSFAIDVYSKYLKYFNRLCH